MEDVRTARRQFQLASIADLQGSIQSHTAKASAALVVHGLLFAGLVTTVSNLGDVWDRAGEGTRWVGAGLLLGAAVCFLISIFHLFTAAEPGKPSADLRKSTAELCAFFPPDEPDAASFEQQLDRIKALTSEDHFEQQYAAEQVKLADLRLTQANAAKRGFWLLRGEIGFAAAFLLLVALEAAVGL